jgi:hypothetical protein
VFTWRRLWVLDRNFPGVARIKRLTAVTHVLVRLKSDITVTRIGDFLPDGSYMADVSGKDGKIRMRVIENYVEMEGQNVGEMFCLERLGSISGRSRTARARRLLWFWPPASVVPDLGCDPLPHCRVHLL